MAIEAVAYFLEEPGKPLSKKPLYLADPSPTEAVVEVEACGLCHTDLGFANGSVAPRHPLPLVLGHEIAGKVVAAGEGAAALIGKRVLVPAVLPCGECALCLAGRGNACLVQKMPGNDIHGGFATHTLVPSKALVSLEGAPSTLRIDALGVVADAVSTAYQAVRRSGLVAGDVAFVIGGGGVGGFVAQIAHALGAHVVVCDVSPARLESARALGAEQAIDLRGRDAKDVRKEAFRYAKQWGVPPFGYRIFECSGTTAGQLQAYTLLANAGTLVIVGFTRDLVNLRLSNLMAFDATVHGSWGCPVEAYPAVLELIYQGKVAIEPFIERAPMSQLNDLLAGLSAHTLTRRMVLDPRE
jgi:6-hydroxycyclohex-1-ene-1-carbonyl-CoA dehydrogenase